MSYGNSRDLLQQYSRTAVESEIEGASPHRLVQMLMEGALEKIATAKGHMLRREHTAKGRQINWAVSIINGLRMSLNKEAGGELAGNLDALYDYMVRRLMKAHADNDPAGLDEVGGLIIEIKSGWDGVPAILAREQRATQRGPAANAAAAGA